MIVKLILIYNFGMIIASAKTESNIAIMCYFYEDASFNPP